jgi:hypothetical protein
MFVLLDIWPYGVNRGILYKAMQMTNSWIWAAKGGVKKRNRFLSFTRFTLLGISVSSVA